MIADDTIFALSSGAPPAGIGVVRVSGPNALAACEALAGRIPPPRRASLAYLYHPCDKTVLDQAMVLALPGPNTVTGEDLVELHLHGGRAVIRAVEQALDAMDGLRPAEPGEFTRRSFAHGRIDLAEAEALGDLLSAETEWQRRAALTGMDGQISKVVADWRDRLLALSAHAEAALDFSDEDDVEAENAGSAAMAAGCKALATAIRVVADTPPREALFEGVKVVLAGPPNSGKSTLLNRLVDKDAAIVSPIAGTTRDVITVPVALRGVAFSVTDTAGLHAHSDDPIEAIGMERAQRAIESADILLWLGSAKDGPDHPRRLDIDAQIDRSDHHPKKEAVVALSAVTGENIDALIDRLVREARSLLPAPDSVSVNRRQRELLQRTITALVNAASQEDALLVAEHLREARAALDALVGRTGTEDMLDTLFGRFCIGK